MRDLGLSWLNEVREELILLDPGDDPTLILGNQVGEMQFQLGNDF